MFVANADLASAVARGVDGFAARQAPLCNVFAKALNAEGPASKKTVGCWVLGDD